MRRRTLTTCHCCPLLQQTIVVIVVIIVLVIVIVIDIVIVIVIVVVIVIAVIVFCDCDRYSRYKSSFPAQNHFYNFTVLIFIIFGLSRLQRPNRKLPVRK